MSTLMIFALLAVSVPATEIAAPTAEVSAAPSCFAVPAPVAAASGGRTADRCTCTATAVCFTSPNLYCSDTSNPCNCVSADRNCSIGERGYVRCNNGPTQYCADPCGGGGECPYELCPADESCSDDSDCCANLEPSGTCQGGKCTCN